MSLPPTNKVQINIVLTANDAEHLAMTILKRLESIRRCQESNPHECTFIDVSPWLNYIPVKENTTLSILPDKRHKGCSGYCHY